MDRTTAGSSAEQAVWLREGRHFLVAGDIGDDGTYPEGTMHFKVEAALDEMAQTARNFGKQDDDSDNGAKNSTEASESSD